jgi:hypothetical protein
MNDMIKEIFILISSMQKQPFLVGGLVTLIILSVTVGIVA